MPSQWEVDALRSSLRAGTLREVAVQCWQRPGSNPEMRLVFRAREEFSVLTRQYAQCGHWTASEVTDLVNQLAVQLQTMLALTPGVQLTLLATE